MVLDLKSKLGTVSNVIFGRGVVRGSTVLLENINEMV